MSDEKAKEIYGWCFECRQPCFLWNGTWDGSGSCRGCAGRAAPIPAEMYESWERLRQLSLKATADTQRGGDEHE